MKKNALILCLIAATIMTGSLVVATVKAQDNITRTYVPIAMFLAGQPNEGQNSTPSATPAEGETPNPTATNQPGQTPSPTGTTDPLATATSTTDPNTTPAPTAPPQPGETPQPTSGPTPITPPAACEQYGVGLARSSRFGVQMYEDTSPASKYFSSLVLSKAGWFRAEVSWGMTEPANTTPQYYDWSYNDHVTSAAGHLNVNVIGTIGFAPGWAANRTNGPIDKVSMDEFLEFVSAAVERYDGDGIADAPCSPVVNYWEMYNEPDRIGEGSQYRRGWGDYPEEYAEMLRAVYPVIKAANPRAEVVFGGIANDWFIDQGGHFVRNWTEKVLDAGGGPYFDIMNLHVYPNFWPEHASQPPGVYEKVQKFRRILANYGYHKPIVITETGANSAYGKHVENEYQARYVVEIFTQALAADTLATIWFMLYDTPDTYGSYRNGLVTDSTPPLSKPALYAYHTAVEFFETANFVRVLSSAETGAENRLAYEFDDPVQNRRFVVAWVNPVDSTEKADMRLPANSAFVYDIYRNATPILDGADGSVDGYVTVRISAQPAFITLPR